MRGRYIDAVIAAAGSGARLGTDTPKAFVEVGGVPLLRYVLDVVELLGARRTIVAVPANHFDLWSERVFEMARHPVEVVAGGATRQASVRAGLEALQEITKPETDNSDHIVMVHDAARPCASLDLWQRVADAAIISGAAIPVLPSVDSLKELHDGGNEVRSIDRDRIVRAQTPQGFRYQMLVVAHTAAIASGTRATDDATLVELSGHPIRAVLGETENIKVTTTGDLDRVARQLVGETPGVVPMRIGHGYDIHPLVEGRRLVLGGVELEYERGLDGHSDADSLVHAIIDALLGAAGLGDIGQKFSSRDQQWKDADSLDLLGAVVTELASAGYRPCNVDATILAEHPRLSPHLGQMRSRLAGRLDLPVDAVNVKATRGEGMGSIGRGEGIAAHAVATVQAV
jgi:2-C-methyl-D-erythritol 4-phosphate cytidylyltransferase/2-C-methyl-D-erythritol 2,4-cyclodiphosphate synthase